MYISIYIRVKELFQGACMYASMHAFTKLCRPINQTSLMARAPRHICTVLRAENDVYNACCLIEVCYYTCCAIYSHDAPAIVFMTNSSAHLRCDLLEFSKDSAETLVMTCVVFRCYTFSVWRFRFCVQFYFSILKSLRKVAHCILIIFLSSLCWNKLASKLYLLEKDFSKLWVKRTK